MASHYHWLILLRHMRRSNSSPMAPRTPSQSSLSGQLLVAMPQMADPRFARTVVYLCAHSAEGAMGLVVNRLIDSLSFGSLLAQLGVEAEGAISSSITRVESCW